MAKLSPEETALVESMRIAKQALRGGHDARELLKTNYRDVLWAGQAGSGRDDC